MVSRPGRVAPFFWLTFAFTWGLQLPGVLAQRGLLPGDPHVYLPLAGLGIFGPFAAAIILTRRVGGGAAVKGLMLSVLRWRATLSCGRRGWRLGRVRNLYPVRGTGAHGYRLPGPPEARGHYGLVHQVFLMNRTFVMTVGVVFGLSGCGFAWRALKRNLEVPSTPRPVAHKIHNPRRTDVRLAALWVGHATVLVQLDDIFVLTDPVLTCTVGELSPRLVEPGLDAQDIPALAAVVVSHMHFDHLSFGSLGMIEDKTPILLVPPGVRSILPRFAFESRELGIWQSYESRGLRITAVPVRHVGGRYGIDQGWNSQAFTGYVLEYHGLTVYFGGDSAFNAADFSATERHFSPIDLALLPICPNRPRDYMRRTHMDPSEALDAFNLLGARRMMPIHFDTFINSDDAPGDCPRLLRQLAHGRRLEEKVAILEIGEQRVFIRK